MNLTRLLPKTATTLGVYQLILLTSVTLAVIIAASFSIVAFKLGSDWQDKLVGQYAIVISPDLEQEKKRDEITNQLVALLKTDPVIDFYRLYQESELENMIDFWLGDKSFGNQLRLPIIAEIKPTDLAAFKPIEFINKYKQKIANIELDDYGRFRTNLKNIANEVRFLGVVFFIILMAILIATIGVLVRGLFKVQEESLEIFHIFGASDQLLARIVARRIARQLISAIIIAFIIFSAILFLFFSRGEFEISQGNLEILSISVAVGLPIFLILLGIVVFLIAYNESVRQISKWF